MPHAPTDSASFRIKSHPQRKGRVDFLKDWLRKVQESELGCRPQNPLGGGRIRHGESWQGIGSEKTWPWLGDPGSPSLLQLTEGSICLLQGNQAEAYVEHSWSSCLLSQESRREPVLKVTAGGHIHPAREATENPKLVQGRWHPLLYSISKD